MKKNDIIILTVDLKINPKVDFTITANLNNDSYDQLIIDWGVDNTRYIITHPGEFDITYTYPEESINENPYRTITILSSPGTIVEFTTAKDTVNQNNPCPIVLIEELYLPGVLSLCFGCCEYLTCLNDNLFKNCPELLYADYLFWNCKTIDCIPNDLFHGSPKIESLTEAFAGCTELKELPTKLFEPLYNLKMIHFCFSGCTQMSGNINDLKIYSDTLVQPIGLFNMCPKLTGSKKYFIEEVLRIDYNDDEKDTDDFIISL